MEEYLNAIISNCEKLKRWRLTAIETIKAKNRIIKNQRKRIKELEDFINKTETIFEEEEDDIGYNSL